MTNFVAIDVETANAFMGSRCQVGAVRFENGREVDAISWLVDPRDDFDELISASKALTRLWCGGSRTLVIAMHSSKPSSAIASPSAILISTEFPSPRLVEYGESNRSNANGLTVPVSLVGYGTKSRIAAMVWLH